MNIQTPSVASPLTKLHAAGQRRNLPAGQILYYPGDLVQNASILEDGVVKVYDIDRQGNEKVLHLMQSPALLPLPVFGPAHTPVDWYYACLTDCVTRAVPLQILRRAVHADSNLATFLTGQLYKETRQIMMRLSGIEKARAPEKLLATMRFLAENCAVEQPDGWRRVRFAITQQLIADLSGLTRETVATSMKELQVQRIVRQPKSGTLEISAQLLM